VTGPPLAALGFGSLLNPFFRLTAVGEEKRMAKSSLNY